MEYFPEFVTFHLYSRILQIYFLKKGTEMKLGYVTLLQDFIHLAP